MRRLDIRLLEIFLWVLVFAAGAARADNPLDQTNIAAAASVPQPVQYSFTAQAGGSLTLTLTDLKTPAAFTWLRVAVTTADTLVGSAIADSSGVATVSIPATAGTSYTVYIVGSPNSTQGIGFFGACVAPASSATSCIAADSYSGSLVAPSTVSTTGTSSVSTNFTSTVAGAYSVTITDDALPLALQSFGGGISQGSTVITPSGLQLGTTSVTLGAATSYQLILAAVANSTWEAGLYGVHITDPTGAVVFDQTFPVGTMPTPTIIDNPTSQTLSLTLTDYGYPVSLADVGTAVTAGGNPALATLTATGSESFAASSGSLEIWQFAAAGSQPGVYGVKLGTDTTSLYSTTKVVNNSSSTATSYAFLANIPAAGTYTLTVTDFQFPYPFQSLGTPSVAQNGTVLAVNSSGEFTAGAGPAIVLVNPTPPASGDGIFDVSIETTASTPSIVLDQTQAVGSVFTTTAITLGAAGSYAVTLTDLGFPSDFQYLAVVASQGKQVLGKIYTGGTFDFTAEPTAGADQYVFTFIATPTTNSATASLNGYGLYSVLVAPAAPTLNFSAGASSVTVDQTVQLTWSTQDATACTASGASGWSGSEPTDGSVAVQIESTSTLTLTCTGPGGSVTQSVNVTATPAASGSSSGGGALSGDLILLLGALVWLTRVDRPARRRRALLG
jgi:hypothetical protein